MKNNNVVAEYDLLDSILAIKKNTQGEGYFIEYSYNPKTGHGKSAMGPFTTLDEAKSHVPEDAIECDDSHSYIAYQLQVSELLNQISRLEDEVTQLQQEKNRLEDVLTKERSLALSAELREKIRKLLVDDLTACEHNIIAAGERVSTNDIHSKAGDTLVGNLRQHVCRRRELLDAIEWLDSAC